jgi:hypothetical protein
MTRYDDVHHNPPAPLASVIVRNPETGAELSDVPMLIDSGADVTLLPAAVVKNLKLQIITGKGTELADFDGTVRRIAYPALAVMEIGGFRFKGQYLSGDSEIGVIGRNILNSIVLELNGPSLVWSMRRS